MCIRCSFHFAGFAKYQNLNLQQFSFFLKQWWILSRERVHIPPNGFQPENHRLKSVFKEGIYVKHSPKTNSKFAPQNGCKFPSSKIRISWLPGVYFRSTPHPGCQSPPGLWTIFRIGNPNLNLHLPLASWVGGRPKVYSIFRGKLAERVPRRVCATAQLDRCYTSLARGWQGVGSQLMGGGGIGFFFFRKFTMYVSTWKGVVGDQDY